MLIRVCIVDIGRQHSNMLGYLLKALTSTDFLSPPIQISKYGAKEPAAGHDSPGIAPRGACPPPKIGKALPGLPRQYFHVVLVLCIAFTLLYRGAPGMPWP